MRTDDDDGGRLLWSQIPQFVVSGVMEKLRWERGASATFRMVCRGWQQGHDSLLPALHIVMSDAYMMGSSHCSLERFTGVKTMTLSGCRNVTGEWLSRALLPLKSLTSLYLNECSKVTNEGLMSLSSHTALTRLGVDGSSKVTDAGLRSLSSLAALAYLNLSGCSIKVTDEGLKSIANLTDLSILNLRDCSEVTDEGLRSLSSLTALTRLGLDGCSKVTDEGLMALSTLTALTDLNLRGCSKVTNEGLTRSLPSLSARLTSLGLRSI